LASGSGFFPVARNSSLDIEVMALRFMVIITNLGGVFSWEKFAKSKAWKLLKDRISTEEEQEFKAVCLANEQDAFGEFTGVFGGNEPTP
jgi:hypothetical protein